MKLNRFLAVSLFVVTLSVLNSALACGPFYYDASDKYFYRIMPYWQEESNLPQANLRKENCLLWHKQVPGTSVDAIEAAIYDTPLHTWQELYQYIQNPSGSKPQTANRFLQQLLKPRNHDALRLLYWSKLYEYLRNKQTNPWHYSCGNEDELTLKTLADSAICHIRGRYATRHLFLAIKCLYTLCSDQECLRLWQQHSPRLSNDCIRHAAEGYVAGCMYRLDMLDQATSIFVRHGDMESLASMGRPLPDVLKAVYNDNPNSPYLPIMLQRILRVINHDTPFYYNDLSNEGELCFVQVHEGQYIHTLYDHPEPYHDQDEYSRNNLLWFNLSISDLHSILTLCKKANRNHSVRHKALWAYTAAAILEYFKRPQEAVSLIDNANLSTSDPFLRRSIQFMRFYLHARYDTIDSNYFQMLQANIRQLDRYIKSDYLALSHSQRKKLKEIYNDDYQYRDHTSPTVTIYSNDALQYILFAKDSAVCRRLVRHGREKLALQLANLGSTRFETLLFGQQQNLFGCELFMLADGLSADTLRAYYQSIFSPANDFERFLTRRGLSNHDYWCDLIGTHLLREQRFPLAAKYLGACSEDYDEILNVKPYFENDPFKMERTPPKHHSRHRYHFAQEMAQLEHQMRVAPNPNTRAESQLRYSIGLRNAAIRDWALLAYGYFTHYDDLDKTDTTNITCQYLKDYWGNAINTCSENAIPYRVKAHHRAAKLQQQALDLYTDPEAKAQGYAMLWMVSRVMHELPNTRQAKYYARHCDQWHDYILPHPSKSK